MRLLAVVRRRLTTEARHHNTTGQLHLPTIVEALIQRHQEVLRLPLALPAEARAAAEER